MVTFILYPNNVNEELGNDLYTLVLPMEGVKKRTQEGDSEEEDSTIYTQKHSTKIKMSSLAIHTVKSIDYLIELQCQMSNLRIRLQLKKSIEVLMINQSA